MKNRKPHGARILAAVLAAGIALSGCGTRTETEEAAQPIPIKVLLLPKFEKGEISGDDPGEAQFYYEGYLDGADTYEIHGGHTGSQLYVKDGVALYVTGMGKVNAALSTMAVLNDKRFDFSDAYIISTGCAGSARDTTVMGDVFVISAAVDYDLGHHADSREMEDPDDVTWFHDDDYDASAMVALDRDLTNRVYELVKDVKVETTERTRRYMLDTFDQAEWAGRDPKVLRGAVVSGDNYWKGRFDHENALHMVQTYGCEDPFAAAEMEDVAIANTVRRLGMLERLIILRDSVNMDVFMLGTSPEQLWDPEDSTHSTESTTEYADIFPTAMENNYKVGCVIIDAILNDTLMAD